MSRKQYAVHDVGKYKKIQSIACVCFIDFLPLVSVIIGLQGTLAGIPFLHLEIPLGKLAATKVYLFYFSLSFLFAGSFIYSWCPEFIKRYENSLEFIKADLKVHMLTAPMIDVVRLAERRLREHGPCISLINPGAEVRFRAAILDLQTSVRTDKIISEETAAEFMMAHWNFMMRSMPIRRMFSIGAYWIGLILLGISMCISVCQVTFQALG